MLCLVMMFVQSELSGQSIQGKAFRVGLYWPTVPGKAHTRAKQSCGFFEEVTSVSQLKSWIRRLGHPEKPRAERRTPLGLAAWQTNNLASKPSAVRDISPSGLYVLTDERWPVDELVSLTVELESFPEDLVEDWIPVQARVVRHGEDGIGLAFVLPVGLDPDLWAVLVDNAVVLTDPKVLLYTFRLLRTSLFLCRICQEEANQALQLLGGELDKSRTEIAMEIALGAEKLLASEPDADKMRAHLKTVVDILHFGSWALDDLTRQLWMGLFATSCYVDAVDESTHDFIDLLVNVTPAQGLILVIACQKAKELALEVGDRPSARVIYTPEEIIRLTGIYDPMKIGVEISYLFNAGLMAKVFDFTSYLPTESLDLTPSRLGLELFKRCKADRIQLRSPLEDSHSTPSP
jgi:hypothetical protein